MGKHLHHNGAKNAISNFKASIFIYGNCFAAAASLVAKAKRCLLKVVWGGHDLSHISGDAKKKARQQQQ